MVKGILADVNIEAHVDYLIALSRSPEWVGLWQELGFDYLTFADVGLNRHASDTAIWQCCQTDRYILITNNRNRSSPDSLESAIQMGNTVASLPVLTIADTERFRRNRGYADEVVESFLATLIDIEQLLGTGRLYLP